jgi:predicted dehydrogenase
MHQHMTRKDLLRKFGRRVRLGMVGGGADSVIGLTHLLAMRVDGFCELVAGAMSVDPKIAVLSGQNELLAADRIYTDFQEMAVKEAQRSDGIDAVVIATPPQLHYPAAKAFLEVGIDVVCEKPMTKNVEEARELCTLVAKTGKLFCLTHCYTGYPMVRQARQMILSGIIGKIRLIEAELSAGDSGVMNEPKDPSRRHWRFRVGSMGKHAILGEVGSHAYNIACFVTGLTAEKVSADMETFAEGREVFDNAYLTVAFKEGVRGRIWSSYVAAGHDHGLRFQIFGESGNLAWEQENAEELWHKPVGGPAVRWARGYDELSPESLQATRFRPGHPEGYALAFANLYSEFACALMARSLALPAEQFSAALPTVNDGLVGMQLIEAARRSNEQCGQWCPTAASD